MRQEAYFWGLIIASGHFLFHNLFLALGPPSPWLLSLCPLLITPNIHSFRLFLYFVPERAGGEWREWTKRTSDTSHRWEEARHHHLTTVHVTPLRYGHSLFLGEVTNRVNERSGVTVNGGDGNGVTSWPLRVSFWSASLGGRKEWTKRMMNGRRVRSGEEWGETTWWSIKGWWR